jgi:hypothetical protein
MQAALEPLPGYAAVTDDVIPVSSVSWPSIIGGTVVAVAAALVLVTLLAGVGLGSLSPWPHASASVTTFTAMTAVGMIIVQWLSAGIGGYVTGRLRTRWNGLHTHEVFYRDTAHGLITWAVATLLVSATTAVIAGSTGGVAMHAVAAASGTSPMPAVDPYDVDTLLRPSTLDAQAVSQPTANDLRIQTTRILSTSLGKGEISTADQAYLAQIVSAEGRVSPADAKVRVDAAAARIKSDHDQALVAADNARKAGEAASIFTALAMMIGAFIACIAAVLGGHRRDVHA